MFTVVLKQAVCSFLNKEFVVLNKLFISFKQSVCSFIVCLQLHRFLSLELACKYGRAV